ncbi:hypothetical protein [Flavobacterium foetidum]|nr:hypothetical protein [Flavobacterium foetidum]KAF2511230.1 hypothetical protein E0W73_16935 [Flavobacterium foetidum]
MKSVDKKSNKVLRKQVLKSAVASFKIEGIDISKKEALNALKKVELNLGK